MRMLLLSLFCIFLSQTSIAAPLPPELKNSALAPTVTFERDPDFVPVPVPPFIPPLPLQSIDNPNAAIPEPATWILIGLGLVVMLRTRIMTRRTV